MTEPWTRHVKIGDCDLYLGDCLSIMPALGKVDACVCDPPYGMTFLMRGKAAKVTDGAGKTE